MSDELQAEVDRLKALSDKLAKDLVAAHDDLKEVRGEARDRRHENKALAQQLAELTAQRDQFKAAAEAQPDDLRKEIDGHRQVIRQLRHEKAYEAVAKGLKVSDPARLADLAKLAAYQPDADEPDPAKIEATFREALKGRPWLVDQPAADAATTAPGGAPGATTTQAPAVPGPGSDRGQSPSDSTTSAPPSKPAGRL